MIGHNWIMPLNMECLLVRRRFTLGVWDDDNFRSEKAEPKGIPIIDNFVEIIICPRTEAEG